MSNIRSIFVDILWGLSTLQFTLPSGRTQFILSPVFWVDKAKIVAHFLLSYKHANIFLSIPLGTHANTFGYIVQEIQYRLAKAALGGTRDHIWTPNPLIMGPSWRLCDVQWLRFYSPAVEEFTNNIHVKNYERVKSLCESCCVTNATVKREIYM